MFTSTLSNIYNKIKQVTNEIYMDTHETHFCVRVGVGVGGNVL